MAQEKNQDNKLPERDEAALFKHFKQWREKGYVTFERQNRFQHKLTDQGREAVEWDKEFRAALQKAQDDYGDMGFQRALAGNMPDLTSQKSKPERRVGKAMSAIEALAQEGYLQIDDTVEVGSNYSVKHPRVTLTDKGAEAITHVKRLYAAASVLRSYGDDDSLEEKIGDVEKKSRSSSIKRW